MPKKKLQSVNFDAKPGDIIVISGVTYKVIDTYPDWIRVHNSVGCPRVFDYSFLNRAGATYVPVQKEKRK